MISHNSIMLLSFFFLFPFLVLLRWSNFSYSLLPSSSPSWPFCSLEPRPIGDHPAATPAATIPAMTVGAPRAELERDRLDLERLRGSGLAGALELKLLSLVGV